LPAQEEETNVNGSIILNSSFMKKGVLEVAQVMVQWWTVVNKVMELAMEHNRIIKCAVFLLSGYYMG
jgi:hypothetical protein